MNFEFIDALFFSDSFGGFRTSLEAPLKLLGKLRIRITFATI